MWVRPELATGMLVNTGDELLRIDDTDFVATAAEAEAQLALRRKEFAEEEAESLRSAREWKLIGSGDPSDLVLRKPQMAAAQARIKAAEAALIKAKHDIERTIVRAPYRARIERKAVDLGSRVTPGSELLTLQAADAYEVVMAIALDDLRYLSLPLRGEILQEGPPVTVSASLGDSVVTWPGHIIRTEAGLNDKTRMVQAIARLASAQDDQAFPLLTGLFVRVTIAGVAVENVAELPLNVLQADDVVYVYQPSKDALGVAHQRKTTVIERTDTTVLLRGNLQDGDLIISGRVSGIREGMQVKREVIVTLPSPPMPAGSAK
jgi:RND family efflux transporter MFP subunit